jgi:ABC-type Zn uptake system ZnuABC Zn-binding protein ZnuA
LPKKPTTKVNIKKLEELVKKHSINWTLEENTKAKRAIKSLKHRAPACQMKELPSLRQKNAPSAYEHADKFTDTMREWVAAGVVAGPSSRRRCLASGRTV